MSGCAHMVSWYEKRKMELNSFPLTVIRNGGCYHSQRTPECHSNQQEDNSNHYNQSEVNTQTSLLVFHHVCKGIGKEKAICYK